MDIKEIREILTDEEIEGFIKARHVISHLEIHDDAIIAWNKEGNICFAAFTADNELAHYALTIKIRLNNLKVILES